MLARYRSGCVLQLTAVLCLLLMTLYTYIRTARYQESATPSNTRRLKFPLQTPTDSPLRQSLVARLNNTNAALAETAENTYLELNLKLDHSGLKGYLNLIESALGDAFALPDSHGVHTRDREIRVTNEVAELAVLSFSFADPASLPLSIQDKSDPCQMYMPRSPVPHLLHTVVRSDADVPEAFEGWRRMLSEDWTINVFNESLRETWLEEHTPEHTSIADADGSGSGSGSSSSSSSSLLSIYRNIPIAVVRGDLFRYIVLYFHGGIYADSDTSPTQDVSLWLSPSPSTSTDLTPPSILVAEALLHFQRLASHGCPLDSTSYIPPNETPPQLIVALESDITTWKSATEVGLQLVQYTFAAAPGHPVFLDIIQRVLNVSRTVASRFEAGDFGWTDDGFVLSEWSGPGLWTEAVYRYLIARWGFDIRMLDVTRGPVRVGDVLILHRDAFRANSGQAVWPDEGMRYVHHDFRGFERWRKGTERKAAQMEEIRQKYEELVAEKVEEMERVNGVEIVGRDAEAWKMGYRE